MTQAIDRLLKPRSVAVIGASADANKTAGRPIAYLLKHGYKGDIYPVNPRVSDITGLKCYADIASLPGVPDVAIVLLGADRVLAAVQELSKLGTAAAIVLASGYSEVGPEGAANQAALAEAAGNMRILGPNTIGLVNLSDSIVLSASSALEMDRFPRGSIAVISQSGGILGSLLSRAAAGGIGLSKLISTSNEVDLDLADFIDTLADDPATSVIALYVESVRDPVRFRAAARKVARAGKPIVAFKIGRSEAGALAAASHTGAMAGADRMYEALFTQLGIIRAQRFSDLLDIASALVTQRVLKGRRVAILTSTGGAGTLVSDSLGMAGFEAPPPDPATAIRLRALQTGDHAALDRNPIDVTLAGLQPELLRGAISALLDSPSYDALVLIAGSSALAMPELMAGAIAKCLPHSNKPVLAYVSPHAPHVAAILTEQGVPAFNAPESCAVALVAMWNATHSSAGDASTAPPGTTQARSVESLRLPSGALDEAQAKQLFACFGIPGVKEIIVDSATEAEQAARALGSRVVLKILSSTITHKSDIGGVAVDVSAENIAARFEQMRIDVNGALAAKGESFQADLPQRFVVQEMIPSGVELILGMHRDPLGTAILVGAGGVTAEITEDNAMIMLPDHGGIDDEAALRLIQSLKIWPLLNGFRGRPKANVAALTSAIAAFSEMVAQLGSTLSEAEINPLFVLPQGVVAADAVVVLTS
jgi:acetate---CoA ligase (ADP-forming)